MVTLIVLFTGCVPDMTSHLPVASVVCLASESTVPGKLWCG